MTGASEFHLASAGSYSARLHIRRWTPQKPIGRIICFHGLGGSSGEFTYLAAYLSALGYDVVGPDWIGHGESPYRDDVGDYAWEKFVRLAWSIGAAYGGDAVHYLGNSWGGAILYLAMVTARMPARSAVFVDVPMKRAASLDHPLDYIAEVAGLTFQTMEEAEAFLFERRPELRSVPAELLPEYRRAWFRPVEGGVKMNFDPLVAAATTVHRQTNFDLRQHIRRLNTNSLFLYGRHSPFRQAEFFRSACREIPTLTYINNIEAGHPPSLFEPEQVEPIGAFLRANDQLASG